MKKLILTIAAVATVAISAHAQKNAHLNSQTIFKAIPEYQAAIDRIEELTKSYQDIIDKEEEKLDAKHQEFENNQANYSDQQYEQASSELQKYADAIDKYTNDIFGEEGEIYKKRVELIKPIQDKVIKAINDVAKEGGYDFIFDMAGNQSIIYSNASLDVTQKVIDKLGVKK